MPWHAKESHTTTPLQELSRRSIFYGAPFWRRLFEIDGESQWQSLATTCLQHVHDVCECAQPFAASLQSTSQYAAALLLAFARCLKRQLETALVLFCWNPANMSLSNTSRHLIAARTQHGASTPSQGFNEYDGFAHAGREAAHPSGTRARSRAAWRRAASRCRASSACLTTSCCGMGPLLCTLRRCALQVTAMRAKALMLLHVMRTHLTCFLVDACPSRLGH